MWQLKSGLPGVYSRQSKYYEWKFFLAIKDEVTDKVI